MRAVSWPVLWVKGWQPHGLASRAPLRAGRASEAPLRSAPAVRLVASERWPLALRAAVTPQPGLLRHAALGQLWHRESGCRFWWVCTSRGSWPSWPGPRPRLCACRPLQPGAAGRSLECRRQRCGDEWPGCVRSGTRPSGVCSWPSSPWDVSCPICDVDRLLGRCWAVSGRAPAAPRLLSPPVWEQCSGRRVRPDDQGRRVWGSPE